MENNCTIIIPTYNRPNYLKRLLDYYDKYWKGFKVIIADSSLDKKLNKKISSMFPDFQYLGDYSPKTNPYCKIFDALNHVKTKYAVLCGDDDFITPNGIKKSVDFLEKNPDFAVAQGHFISFYLKNNKKFFWTSFPDHKSITLPEATARLVFYLSHHQLLTFYGVHRTKSLMESYRNIIKFTDEGIFSLIMFTALDVIYNKIKCLDILYGAREIKMPQRERTLNKKFMDFIREGTYDKKYANFREGLSIHLSKKSSLTVKESGKLIDDAMPYCLNRVYKRIYGSPMVRLTRLLNKLKLPSWIDGKIRQLYGDLCFIKKVRMDPFWSLIDNPSSKYYKDFNRIRKQVIQWKK